MFRHDPADPDSLSAGEVGALYEDRSGTLWIGTTSGLDRFNPETETFETEPLTQGHLTASIAEDRQGSLWVGYWGGLLRREPGASAFSPVPLAESATDRIQEIYPDRTSALWISTQDAGLFRLDPPAGTGEAEPTLQIVDIDPAAAADKRITSHNHLFRDRRPRAYRLG